MNFFYQIFRLSIFAPIQRHTDLNKSFQEKTVANITSFKILSVSNYYNTNLVLTKLFPFLHKFSRCTNIFHAPSRDSNNQTSNKYFRTSWTQFSIAPQASPRNFTRFLFSNPHFLWNKDNRFHLLGLSSSSLKCSIWNIYRISHNTQMIHKEYSNIPILQYFDIWTLHASCVGCQSCFAGCKDPSTLLTGGKGSC